MNDTSLNGGRSGLGAVADSQLSSEVVDVDLEVPSAISRRCRNFFVAHSLNDELQDLQLARL